MIFPEKLQLLRKTKGLTQEELSEKLNVSRQAIAKWEAGQAYPDISNLIRLSDLMHVTVDYLVKDQQCGTGIPKAEYDDVSELIRFRLEASRNTYAAFSGEVPAMRPDSHDFRYQRGEYLYYDTYVGGEQFAGQEAVWRAGKAIYVMNYAGRVLDERFSGNFLKEALRAADEKMPYRGPTVYQSGEYLYQAKVTGDISWYQGYEEIFCTDIKVYECYFHGGMLK